MIIQWTADRWTARALHSEKGHPFFHVTLWVFSKTHQDTYEGLKFMSNLLFKDRVHFIRVRPEIALYDDIYQGYMRFSYTLDLGSRIVEDAPATMPFGMA